MVDGCSELLATSVWQVENLDLGLIFRRKFFINVFLGAQREEGNNTPPDSSLIRYRKGVLGVLALEAKKGSLRDPCIAPTWGPPRDGELIVTSNAYRVKRFEGVAHSIHEITRETISIEVHLFALPAQVSRVVDVTFPTVGGHWPQAPGADAAAGLAVPARLPVLLLVLPAAVVDFATSGAAAHTRSLDTANGAHRSPDGSRGPKLRRGLRHLQIRQCSSSVSNED